jgi:predicted ATPase with chaperone activity
MSLINFPNTPPARLREPGSAGTNASLPRAPLTQEETGLPTSFLVELCAKVMFQLGLTRLTELSQQMCLSASVVESLCQFMRRESLVEVVRRGQHEADVQYELTQGGRQRAAEWSARNQYVGPAPVPLEAYVEQVRQQSITHQRFSITDVQAALGGLNLPQSWVDQLGTAMNSARPILLYGPAGSGKTFLAASLQRLLHGSVAVPHAILVHGEVIRVFDPHWHRPQPAPSGLVTSALDSRARPDARWVVCQRPVVISGGELTLEMLDLSFDARAGYYEAPPHFKANNGLFIVDDLGRQRVQPQDLMNRWIVPMEHRHDYLMLRNGGKFQIPFDLVLVFATNLKPADISDGAFLRRLGHKIKVGHLPETCFRRMFEVACEQQGLAFDPAAYQRLIERGHRRDHKPMLACQPRDLLHLLGCRATYLGLPASLTPELLDWAWSAYYGNAFARGEGGAGDSNEMESSHEI